MNKNKQCSIWTALPASKFLLQTEINFFVIKYPALTGTFSFCCKAAFFFHRRSRSSLTRLSMTATSELRLFKHSLCCCSLAFCSWFSLFLNWINSQSGGGGGENNKNQNKLTFRMQDRKRLEREKPSKKSSHAGKLRLFSPQKTLISLQNLQTGKIHCVLLPLLILNPVQLTLHPQHAGSHAVLSGTGAVGFLSNEARNDPTNFWPLRVAVHGIALPAAPCTGGRAQLQLTGCHGNHQFGRSSTSPVAWWVPLPSTPPAPARAAFAGTGCSSVQSPPLERTREHNSCPEQQPSVGCFQGGGSGDGERPAGPRSCAAQRLRPPVAPNWRALAKQLFLQALVTANALQRDVNPTYLAHWRGGKRTF